MATTRVKIPRLTLIERIQDKIDKETAAHEKEVAEYQAAIADFMSELPGKLEALAKEIASLKGDDLSKFFRRLRSNNYEGDSTIHLPLKARLPTAPDEYRYEYIERSYRYHGFDKYIAQLEQTKRVLEASNEETISVSTNDRYAQFL